MFHGPCSPFLFREKFRELSPNQFSSWGRSYPNLKHRFSGFSGYTLFGALFRGICLQDSFQDSQSVQPTPWCHSFRGSFSFRGQKRQVCGDDFKEDKHIPLVGWGGYFKNKIQALIIEGLSIAEGDIIFKRVFWYVFALFFEWDLERNDLTF